MTPDEFTDDEIKTLASAQREMYGETAEDRAHKLVRMLAASGNDDAAKVWKRVLEQLARGNI